MTKNYTKINFTWGNRIEDAVKELLIHKERGSLVYGEFNGVKLYSDTVTMDSAYKEITGKTKAEFDEEMEQREENYKRQQREHKDSIPELTKVWQEKARGIISSDKLEYWDKIVPIRLGDLYQGMELGACLDIVKILNNGCELKVAKEMLEDQGHSGMSYSLVCAMVKEFAKRGNDFVEYLNQ